VDHIFFWWNGSIITLQAATYEAILPRCRTLHFTWAHNSASSALHRRRNQIRSQSHSYRDRFPVRREKSRVYPAKRALPHTRSGGADARSPFISAPYYIAQLYCKWTLTPMQRATATNFLRCSRLPTRPTSRFATVQLNLQQNRKMSEIKKVYTKNACPRKYLVEVGVDKC